ncbi:MAG: Na+/H+ antiporter NhaA [Coriobacteriia bacterium]|nr:Na+/H+ antiporter NhaA [Coriobacteriia bacterium]
MQGFWSVLLEYSVPLIAGVVLALVWANVSPQTYQVFLHTELFLGIDFHFIINDVFMALFFGIAGTEIVRSVLPGGALHSVKTAASPLMATAGGVLGPIVIFSILNSLFGSPEYARGWAIPTPTDIALAWFVARIVFGAGHPAVSFLLLLAVVDDAIGLVIIGVFYPNPLAPVKPVWLVLVLAGMALAFILHKLRVRSFVPYIFGGGALAWLGLHNANLHPALALIFIVPFLAYTPKNPNMQSSRRRVDTLTAFEGNEHKMLLDDFEDVFKHFVDFGLVTFGLSNAGVSFSDITNLTWIVFFSLVVGKTLGVFIFGNLSNLIGFSLPEGMRMRELFVTGLVAAMDLTVALFIAGEAFVDVGMQDAAKMGALFTVSSILVSIVVGRLLGVKLKS